MRNTGVPTAVTAGRAAGSGGRTATTRPPGSTVTFTAAHTDALSVPSDVPVSTYVSLPTESRQAYPPNPAVAYRVESTGPSESVVCVAVLAHTIPIAYGTR